MIEKRSIDAIRVLSMDAVQRANSGHPGTPMALAPAGYVLWHRFMNHNPKNPEWMNRDRFVLSCGHASMLIYSLLFLSGYNLSLEDLKNFRQLDSKTPGHPEVGHTPGVETTTGPLGQGLGNAVGMAMAERYLAEKFNQPEFNVIDHYTYAFCSDGDLMEGVGQESASLAGHLGLKKLIVLWDNNEITIEGSTDLAFKENVSQRFQSYGWHVVDVHNGEDLSRLNEAFYEARRQTKPVLINCRTQIGFPSPNKKGTSKAHGEPLGAAEIKLTKDILQWSEPEFSIPESIMQHWGETVAKGKNSEKQWQELFTRYEVQYPDLARELKTYLKNEIGFDAQSLLPLFTKDESIATRESSGRILNALAPIFKNILGGSADLAPSNNSYLKTEKDFTREGSGRNIHFGVREHAMGAILNGLALHGGLRAYGATFLQFADYMRPSIRLAALMKLPVTYIFTHDSIGLGEDGPTHQPIEHLMSLRVIPNICVMRPADSYETIYALQHALARQTGPTAVILTRQKTKNLTYGRAHELNKGGYVVNPSVVNPDIILVASGSEVMIAEESCRQLESLGMKIRLVSMPSLELFLSQPLTYRDSVLPPLVSRRIVIEAGITWGWEPIAGPKGHILGINTFGASAPSSELFKKYGLTADHVTKLAQDIMKIS